jgi:hypothetical protein
MRVFVSLVAFATLLPAAATAQTVAPATTPEPVAAPAAPMPQAKIETAFGTLTIALDRASAPKSVANFIAYARAGH